MSNCPARAGFTGPRRPADAPRWDHPRSRGVYGFDLTEENQRWGSSPLARGLRHEDQRDRRRGRIIPARAGFTWRTGGSAPCTRDHPRSRGVYVALSRAAATLLGSSPLARGLPDVGSVACDSAGIIPARAGFTSRRCSAAATAADHPRSRGVYRRLSTGILLRFGSSPLARGLHEHSRSGPVRLGIIPARAGFTAAPSTRKAPSRDHPRSRGVYPRRPPMRLRLRGSSPLARGLPGSGWQEVQAGGIIPARAGFTPEGRR